MEKNLATKYDHKAVEENKYCCPDSEVLKNKLNIRDKDKLFAAEKKEL